jgi:hypothetical protein
VRFFLPVRIQSALNKCLDTNQLTKNPNKYDRTKKDDSKAAFIHHNLLESAAFIIKYALKGDV